MTLRQQLAEARSSLRTAKDALETAKTVATLEVQGKNEAERKSNTALALLSDRAYTKALTHVRDCEAAVERIEAEIEEEAYALRLREVAARERLAEALVGKRVDDAVVDQIAFEAGRVAGRQVAHEMRRQAPDTTEWFGR